MPIDRDPLSQVHVSAYLKVQAERDRYLSAIDDAFDELLVGDTKTAMAILERAMNQDQENA